MKADEGESGGGGSLTSAWDHGQLAGAGFGDSSETAEAAVVDFREFEAAFVRERAEFAFSDTAARKLEALEVYVARLRELAGTQIEDFARDWVRRGAAERTFEQAVETCAGLVRHVIAERGLREPGTMADGFVIAGEASLLAGDLVERLVPLCRLRNRVVHDGTSVDAVVVLDAVRASVADFERFTAAARAWR